MSSHANSAGGAFGTGEPHITPLKTYFIVFGCLLVLTIATVAVSYAGLPSTMSIIVAMIVASMKASLVVWFFMHLNHDLPFNKIVFGSAVFFAAIFFGFTMLDLSSRDAVLAVEGNFYKKAEDAGLDPMAGPPPPGAGGHGEAPAGEAH